MFYRAKLGKWRASSTEHEESRNTKRKARMHHPLIACLLAGGSLAVACLLAFACTQVLPSSRCMHACSYAMTIRMHSSAPCSMQACIQIYLSILSPARPDPLARPGPARPRTLLHERGQRSWSPRKLFLARTRPEMLFLVVLHYKMRGRPARARPENRGPPRPVGWLWAGFFRSEITEILLSSTWHRPGSKNAQVYIQMLPASALSKHLSKYSSAL
jgi:hypothetical protein